MDTSFLKTLMDGWVILDKPTGITSAHAVNKVKRLLKPKKIGHAGTLDPLASGILPLALGEATKTVPYMMDADKEYAFTVSWGEERDTDDCEGKPTRTSPERPSKAEIEAILPQFTGRIEQAPPAYSAIKVDGERAYALARDGQEVQLAARPITVHSLRISDYTTDKTTFICHCGKGTYIRSLARDMGRVLGCLGHVSMLRRLRVGRFNETRAISLEMLEKIVHKGDLNFVLPVESALDDIPAFELDSSQAARLKRGQALVLPFNPEETPSTVLARHEGKAVAICERTPGAMKPVRVFNL